MAEGESATFTLTANTGYAIQSATGCGGSLSGGTYTTGPITGDCTVTVNVTEVAFSIGGSVSDLSGTLVLQNNSDDDLTVTSDGPFAFNTRVSSSGAYEITVRTQPATQRCFVQNGSGEATADVTTADVQCFALDVLNCSSAGVPGTCTTATQCGGAQTATAGTCPGNLVCCTPLLAAGSTCDPTIWPQPNSGLAQTAGTGGCPEGMLLVDNFCVDRYEASLVEASTNIPWSPYQNPGSTSVVAVSIASAVPQAYINQVQAEAACASAGKRLCTDSEWLRACRGADAQTYPYGNVYSATACNDTSPTNPVLTTFGTTDAWIWNYVSHPCINQSPDSLAVTGQHFACVSAEGLYDMAGNLQEWTADPAGTLRGGSYDMGGLNGDGCLSVTRTHTTEYSDYRTGFRCCADNW
ncbi:MAG: formylglycine-generating enzyme family protein [Gammaproteobacteria bacterium]|nr:formylglycine-generating enzyme family protein [Gammaproteobacteria bacterium]MBU1416831.1 formylglycine-generating enzyme family protein [Gammaproteobacteria bacterium]